MRRRAISNVLIFLSLFALISGVEASSMLQAELGVQNASQLQGIGRSVNALTGMTLLQNLSISGLVIANVRVDLRCRYDRSSLAEDIRHISIYFEYEVWKPERFFALWNPRIIVHVGNFRFSSAIPSSVPEIPANAEMLYFPAIVGPPNPWVKQENWDANYPGAFGSRTVEGDISFKPSFLPGQGEYGGLYFGFDPSYSNKATTCQKLRNGTLGLHFFDQIKVENSLSLRPESIDFGTAYGSERLTIPIVFSRKDLDPLEWSVSSDVSWISMKPTSGNMTIGRVVIEVTANSSDLETGEYSGGILLRSNAGIASIPISLNVISDYHGLDYLKKVINFEVEGTGGASGGISADLGYDVHLNLAADFSIAAGLSLPLFVVARCPVITNDSSLEHAAQVSVSGEGACGRAWMNAFGGIGGSVTASTGSFSIGYRFSHIDLYNLLTNSAKGWDVDFNRLVTFRVPLGNEATLGFATGPIPLYTTDVQMGVITLSVSFVFSVTVNSCLFGNVTIGGAIGDPVKLPVTFTENDAFEYVTLINSAVVDQNGNCPLLISSDDIQYIASDVSFCLEGVTLAVNLVPTSPELLTSPAITRSFSIFQKSVPVVVGTYGPVKSEFSFRMALDLMNPIADVGVDKTVDAGLKVVFHGTASHDNVGIVSYEWHFGDGSNETINGVWGHIASHVYQNPGNYSVTLIVKDAMGNMGKDTITVVVLNPNSGILGAILWVCGALASIGVIGLVVWTKRRRSRRARKDSDHSKTSKPEPSKPFDGVV